MTVQSHPRLFRYRSETREKGGRRRLQITKNVIFGMIDFKSRKEKPWIECLDDIRDWCQTDIETLSTLYCEARDRSCDRRSRIERSPPRWSLSMDFMDGCIYLRNRISTWKLLWSCDVVGWFVTIAVISRKERTSQLFMRFVQQLCQICPR